MAMNCVQFQKGLKMSEVLKQYGRVELKLLQDMFELESFRILEGRIEIDDAYLCVERPSKCGPGSENKVSFVAAV
ncbi:hypothetical protein NTGM5_70139 [Candidatus Nitrotoga sp. M5]|nr:hypothetical protein NTGM5_70139 [Candidatus Nitrotoga sp. M5]